MKARTRSPSRRLRPALASVAAAFALLLTQAVATPASETASTDPNAPSASGAAKPATPPPPPAAASKAAAPSAKVFTNKDLSRYRSAGSPGTIVVDMNAVQQTKDDAAAAAAAAASEPVLYPDEKARRMAELEDGIKEVEARLATIDERAGFLANPFLPPPQLTPEEIKAAKGISQKDAYQGLQAEKATLTEKLAGLKADLATVIATPTRARSTPAATNPAAAEAAPEP